MHQSQSQGLICIRDHQLRAQHKYNFANAQAPKTWMPSLRAYPRLCAECTRSFSLKEALRKKPSKQRLSYPIGCQSSDQSCPPHQPADSADVIIRSRLYTASAKWPRHCPYSRAFVIYPEGITNSQLGLYRYAAVMALELAFPGRIFNVLITRKYFRG